MIVKGRKGRKVGGGYNGPFGDIFNSWQGPTFELLTLELLLQSGCKGLIEVVLTTMFLKVVLTTMFLAIIMNHSCEIW
jgi:hypothetical protein